MSITLPASVNADTAFDRDSLLRRLLVPGPDFEITGPDDAGRAQVEAAVAEKFHSAWQASVTHFMPRLLSMQCMGSCSAVAGIRPPASGPLFLERYLDLPVEKVLANTVQQAVARRDLVEVGNLVSSQRGASHLLFLVMTATLHRAGYKWMVFTATRPLRNNLLKLGFPMVTLAAASPQRLDESERLEWGSYYQSDPQVMAGSLDAAMQLIAERPLLRRVLRLYRYRINYLAEALRGA